MSISRSRRATELPEVEHVVFQSGRRYAVVEKIERAAEVARLLDPRR